MKGFILFYSQLLLSSALLFSTHDAFATCNITAPINANIPAQSPVEVSPETSIGTEIGTISSNFNALGIIGSCDKVGSDTLTFNMGPAVAEASSIANVFNTSVPGVGVKVYIDGYGYAGTGVSYSMPVGDFGFPPVVITFVKTGETPANYPANIFASGTIPFVQIKPNGNGTVGYTANVGVRVSSCDVTTPLTMNISMGKILHSEFGAPGQTSEPVPFNINIRCSGTVQVKATISATSDNNATTANTAIKLTTQESGATGLALQILDSSSNVLTINTTPFDIGTVSGDYTLNWSARYIQVLNAVTSGHADATATVTFSYQ